MSDKDHIQAELRAVREELAHRDIVPHAVANEGMLFPPIDIEFVRLEQLSTEQLKEHEKRLTRDLSDLEIDNPEQLYRPTNTDDEV